VDEKEFPNIVPCFQYGYDMRRAGFAAKQLGPMTNHGRIFWPQQGLYLSSTALYTLVKYRSDVDGGWRTADAGALMHPIWDFCGGMIVTSASISHYARADSNDTFANYQFRRRLPGPKQSGSVGRKFYGSSKYWTVYEQFIPDLSVYTGKAAHSDAEVIQVLTDSMGAAVVSASRYYGRKALFAADIASGGKTRPILNAMHGTKYRFARNARVDAWPKQDAFSPEGYVVELSPQPLVEVLGTFTICPSFNNPNTGRQVSMSQLITEDHTHPRNNATTRWALPNDEISKFNSMDLAMMCPQGLFHN